MSSMASNLFAASCCAPCAQMIGRAFGEADLLQMAHVFEQTAAVMADVRPAVFSQQG